MDLAGGLRVDDLSKTDLFDFVCPDTPHQPFRLGLFTHQEELMEFSSSSNPTGGSNMSSNKDMAHVNHGSSTGNTSFETVWLATPSPDEGYAGSTASGSAHAEEDMDVTAWTGSSNNNNNNTNCTSMLKTEGSANGYATSDAEHNLNNAALTVALLSCDVNWATARIDNNKHENESNSTAGTATSSSASSGGTEPMDLDTLLQMVGFASTNNMSPVPTSCASQHPDSLFGESIASFNSHNSSNNHDHSDQTEAHQKKEALIRSNSCRPQRLEPFASIHPQARRMKSDYGPAYDSPPPPLVPLSSIGKNYWVNPVSAAPTTTTSSISDLNPKMSLLRNALQGKPPQQQPLNSDLHCGTTQQPSSTIHTELRKALSAPVGMANPYVISRQLSTQSATVSMFTRAVTSPLSTVIDPGTPPLTPVSSSALASPYNNGPSPESCLNSPTTPVSLSRQLGSNGHGSPAMTLAHETPNGTPLPNTTSDSICPPGQFVLQFDNRSQTAMSGIKEESQTLTELVSVDPMMSAGEVNMAAEFDFGVYASESIVKLEPGTQRLLMDDVEVGGITNIDDLLMCDIDDIDKLKTYQKEVAESLNQMYHAASRHQLQQSVLEAVLASNSNSNSFIIGPDSFGSADDASVPSSSSNGNPHQNNTASSTGFDNGPKLNGAPVRKKRISKKAKKLLQEQELASSTACSHGPEGNTAGSEENLSTSPGQTSSSTDSLEAKKERLLHYCSICSKGFKDKYSVNVHIRTHTGEKPFACPMCGKNFRQKAHLAKHQQTHSKIPGPSQAKSKR